VIEIIADKRQNQRVQNYHDTKL